MAARATVIVPTFGQSSFARWAVQSVQNQSVKDLEICIICDGSPESMVTFFQTMAQDDARIRVFPFPKSPRTGEPYRDLVIRQTTGNIICYCCHDDLWLPHHVQKMENALKNCRFAHSLHAAVNLPEEVRAGRDLFERIRLEDIKDPRCVRKMLQGDNCFGLTYGAHTRDSYFGLKEGWVTTPRDDIPTDLYMWCKFLAAFPQECATVRKVTALHFTRAPRETWSEQQRSDELESCSQRMQDPEFIKTISRCAWRSKIRHLRRQPASCLRNALRRLRSRSSHRIRTWKSPCASWTLSS